MAQHWIPTDRLIDRLARPKDYVLPRLEKSAFVETNQDSSNVIIDELLSLEKSCAFRSDYFDSVQFEVTPEMRTILLEWMWEVCENEGCSNELFPLAANYLDRFLAVQPMHKRDLQALGTACLFVAGKVKMVYPFTAYRLVEYTDRSVAANEVLSWEFLVLERLNWDVSTLTAHDFLDQYLHRFGPKLSGSLIARLRPCLNRLVNVSVIDFPTASALPPSLVAASCLRVAVGFLCRDADDTASGAQLLMTMTRLKPMMINEELVAQSARRIFELFAKREQLIDNNNNNSNSNYGDGGLIEGGKWASSSADHHLVHFGEYIIDAVPPQMFTTTTTTTATSSLTPTDIEDVIF